MSVITLFLVVFLVNDEPRLIPAKSLTEVCALRRKHDDAVVFKVNAYSRGRWLGGDADMRAVLVECAPTFKPDNQTTWEIKPEKP